ncbi:MAG: hypothetical protein R2568_07000 [Candidatus Scalindua sp.]|nr:hypothetical protein [Candidatus Scalindua sp.]MDV5166482.1 hypothetical protein [Candidatus Scalindua sp.]
MIAKKLSIVCAVFIVGLFISLQILADEFDKPDPTFKLAATLSPIDGGQLYIGGVDKDKKTFRLHLRHIGKDGKWVYYYASASAFVNEDGDVESDSAVASIEYPQYTASVVGNTFRKATVRILFSHRGDGKGFFKEAGQVIFQKCATKTFEVKNWSCTGWEYLGTLSGFQ